MSARLASARALVVSMLCSAAAASTGCASQGPLVPAQPGVVEVAVTIDDLPVHGPLVPGKDRVAIAEQMLAALRKHAVPRVYGFVNARRVDEDPATEAVLRRWVEAGQMLGNHSWSHPSLTDTGVREYVADIARGEPLLERLQPGSGWRYFRYPFLYEGETLEKRRAVRGWLRDNGYTIAEVSIDADDWAYNGPYARCTTKGDLATVAALRRELIEGHVDELARMRALGKTLTGREIRQVLLLHVGVAEADTLDDLLTAYERAGARWIELPTALADPFYAQDPDQASKAGAAFPYRVAKARGVSVAPAVYARGLEERLERTCR